MLILHLDADVSLDHMVCLDHLMIFMRDFAPPTATWNGTGANKESKK